MCPPDAVHCVGKVCKLGTVKICRRVREGPSAARSTRRSSLPVSKPGGLAAQPVPLSGKQKETGVRFNLCCPQAMGGQTQYSWLRGISDSCCSE